ncbi:MAG: hypothetical protein MJE66_20005, partial [Proteobacteria bacterium]|nr:hypothetical protein [Pseudomonadota bacterium]
MKRAITAALVLCAGASLGMRCFTPAQPILVQVTERLPSAATPAETPGTDGVVVTNPKLLAQFGPDADLNQATYTRYLLSDGMLEQPDAILVTIPGFQGGAAGFEILAENAIRRMRDEQGLVLEVWAFDRRSNQLEDLEGLNIAEVAADPQIGLDWLFGSELGLTLSPELAAGPNRRVVFYNPTDDIPFFANWTPLVHSQDVDAVIEAALAEAKNGNVFLGGHSAGTGFLARYAATDFDLSGVGPAEPGYAKVRGLVLFEGGGGSIGAPPTDDDLDRIEARFDGGLFGAVRDGAPRCIDGATPCAVASEDVDCAAFANTKCTPSTTAYSQLFGLLGAETFAAVEPAALQADLEGDSTQLILAQDQNGIPGNSALQQVPGLGLLVLVLPDATGRGAIGSFLDDDGGVSQAAAFIATSLGAPGPEVNGLVTWLGIDEPLPPSVLPDNGPAPTTLP